MTGRVHLLRLLPVLIAAGSLAASPAHASRSAPPPPLDAPGERFVLSVLTSYRTGVTAEQERLAAKTLFAVAEEQGVDPFLVLGVIRVESSVWTHARSSCDARGLMQIRPFVGKALAREAGIPWRGPDDLHDPVLNIRLGVRYLATLIGRYGGDVEKALLAYSMGPARLDDFLRRGKRPRLEYAVTARYFAEQYRALASVHGDVEPGLSRFTLGVLDLERTVGGKPKRAYQLALQRAPPPAAPATKRRKVELDSASFAELLLAHPAITPRAAKAIVDDRAAHGPFRSIDAVARVPGLDPSVVEALRESSVVGHAAEGDAST